MPPRCVADQRATQHLLFVHVLHHVLQVVDHRSQVVLLHMIDMGWGSFLDPFFLSDVLPLQLLIIFSMFFLLFLGSGFNMRHDMFIQSGVIRQDI